MTLAVVKTLYDTNGVCIPDMLRQTADNLEKDEGVPIKSMIAVTVDEDGDIEVYGWGRTDGVDTLATLQLAVVKMSLTMLGHDDD